MPVLESRWRKVPFSRPNPIMHRRTGDCKQGLNPALKYGLSDKNLVDLGQIQVRVLGRLWAFIIRGRSMNAQRQMTPLVLALSAALLAGCSSTEKQPTPEWTGTPFEVTEYAPDLRDHHTSWGHHGRGGAAMRKPAYQPVLGSPDVLETRAGKLHPELQHIPQPINSTISVPPGLVAGNCAQATTSPNKPAIAFPAAANATTNIYTLANSYGSVDEYIKVRNKLCAGVERLTYEEWEILVMGTPKDVPLKLQKNQLNEVTK